VAEAFHVYLGATKVATRELTPSAAWAFYSSDHLGTPRLKTGERPQGQSLAPVLESYRYRAFGERFEALGQAERAGREFAMMERDAILPPGATAASGTGNHYVHARFFADRFARFLSPDQINGRPEDPQSWNRYTYARNNPLKYVDPDGRAIETAWDVASFVVGAGSFIRDVGAGSYGAAALDLGGMVVDGLAVATPFVPGGAGAGIRAARLAAKAEDVIDAGRAGAVALDTNAIIARLEGAPKDVQAVVKAMGDRQTNVSITAVKEFLKGGGDVTALRSFLQSTGGSVGKAPSKELLEKLTGLGLKPADARVVGSAMEQGIPVLTRDKQILKKVPGAAERF
jgi:RHS repeat-associated protein